MKHLLPIHWYDGMTLIPALFQQEYVYLMNYINIRFPFSWGIVKLYYDELLLSANKLKIDEILCIDHDGIMFYYNTSLLNYELSIELPETPKDIYVYLIIPNLNNIHLNITELYTDQVSNLNTINDISTIIRYGVQGHLEISYKPKNGILIHRKINISKSTIIQKDTYEPPKIYLIKDSTSIQLVNSLVDFTHIKITHRNNNYSKSILKDILILRSFLQQDKITPYQLFERLYSIYIEILILQSKIPEQLIYDHYNMYDSIKIVVEKIYDEFILTGNINPLYSTPMESQGNNIFHHLGTVVNCDILISFKGKISTQEINTLIENTMICCEIWNYQDHINSRSIGESRKTIKIDTNYDSTDVRLNIHGTLNSLCISLPNNIEVNNISIVGVEKS